MSLQSSMSSNGKADPFVVAYRLAHRERRYGEAKDIVENLLEWSQQGARPLVFLKKRAEWLLIDIAVHQHQGARNGCYRDGVPRMSIRRLPYFDDKVELLDGLEFMFEAHHQGVAYVGGVEHRVTSAASPAIQLHTERRAMPHQGSEHGGQGHWFSRSTSHVVSCGWTEGVTRGRSWSGTEPLPADWYFEALIEEVRDELQRLKAQRVCTTERLSELATKLMTAINQVPAE
jgi:hypothetical protein